MGNTQLAELRKKVSKWSKDQMISKLNKISEGGLTVTQDELDVILEIAQKRNLPIPESLLSNSEVEESVEEVSSEPEQEKSVKKAKTESPKKAPKEKATKAPEKKTPAPKKEVKKKETVAKKEVKKPSKQQDKKLVLIETISGEKVEMCKSDYVRYLIKEESIRSHKQIKLLVQEKFDMSLYYSEFDRCRKNVDGKPKKKQ